jgi:hypothetical protein
MKTVCFGGDDGLSEVWLTDNLKYTMFAEQETNASSISRNADT